jgi:quercetin dioxygenase-like cupin family protein
MKYTSKEDFKKANMFGTGIPNFMLSKVFIGKSYLKPVVMPGKGGLFLANVTFEPGCRNHWHIHHAATGGGQILVCTAGEGLYQEEGKAPVELKEGSVVYIAPEVNHWHGAKADSWFSHITVEVPGVKCRNEWVGPVTDDQYAKANEAINKI